MKNLKKKIKKMKYFLKKKKKHFFLLITKILENFFGYSTEKPLQRILPFFLRM